MSLKGKSRILPVQVHMYLTPKAQHIPRRVNDPWFRPKALTSRVTVPITRVSDSVVLPVIFSYSR
jgi:hypothetical protein